ncbi:MiAMP1 family antimicrobial peptide [Streptomyces sp. AK02-01A]|uniref:MiAMP1 family antimicrobial peptide n=1 Tax=Streptomyces sp. AK02-01A TaxID=3028648 RepID=UPI0029A47109|nr:MiAMP1 family antimicrobial peptide [Streptomyces sp. AK02-01A]MDX3853279.1 MiAMP1 family antimicrobial peptide [Streptomyces sp. AK02-01A]
MRNRHALRSAVTAAVMTSVLALGTSTAFASSFLSWEGPQDTGRAKQITPCGCSNIDPNFRAAYRFDHTGQDATMYNSSGCRGVSHYTFRGDSHSAKPFGWRSIFIHC